MIRRFARSLGAVVPMMLALLLAPKAAVHASGGLPCRYTTELIFNPYDCGPFFNSHAGVGDINDFGVVCGTLICGGSNYYDAFTWDPINGVRLLALPPGTFTSTGHAINSSGTVMGDFGANVNGNFYGGVFLSTGDLVETILQDPGGIRFEASALTNNGKLTGSWGPPPTGNPFPLAYRYDGTLEDLSPILTQPYSWGIDIAEDGTVCGSDVDFYPTTLRGFIARPGQPVEYVDTPRGAFGTEFHGINNHGVAIGIARVPGGTFLGQNKGFVYRDGVRTPIPPHPTLPEIFPNSTPLDINDSETIIGTWGAFNSGGHGEPFVMRGGEIMPLWEPGNPLINVPTPAAINQRGQILANAELFNGRLYVGGGIVYTPVPVPTGDVNCDDLVNVDDLLGVINAWDQPGGRPDIDDDGIVGLNDLVSVLDHWTFGDEDR